MSESKKTNVGLPVSKSARDEVVSGSRHQIMNIQNKKVSPEVLLDQETERFQSEIMAVLNEAVFSRDPDLGIWSAWLNGDLQYLNSHKEQMLPPRGRAVNNYRMQTAADLARSEKLKSNADALQFEAQEKLKQAADLRRQAEIDDAFILQYKLKMIIDKLVSASAHRFAMGFAWFFVDVIAESDNADSIREIIAVKGGDPAFRAGFLMLLDKYCREQATEYLWPERNRIRRGLIHDDPDFNLDFFKSENMKKFLHLMEQGGFESAKPFIDSLKGERRNAKQDLDDLLGQVKSDEEFGLAASPGTAEQNSSEEYAFDPFELEEAERELSRRQREELKPAVDEDEDWYAAPVIVTPLVGQTDGGSEPVNPQNGLINNPNGNGTSPPSDYDPYDATVR